MKYSVTFQRLPAGGARPIDHNSTADYEVTAQNAGMIPAVGDFVHIEPLGNPDAPRYSGRVRSRLFAYFGDHCNVNIVVEDADDANWGEFIKE